MKVDYTTDMQIQDKEALNLWAKPIIPVLILATQEEAQLCAAAARQNIEDIQLLQVLQESGVDEVTAKRIFHTEVN